MRVAMAAAVLTLALLSGCPSPMTIAKLQNDSGRYMGKKVIVHGRVVTSVGILGSGAYEVDDGTGTIWVLSNGRGVAGNGAKVDVVGVYVNGVSVGGHALASAIEQTKAPTYLAGRD